jgi:hypothetical protein
MKMIVYLFFLSFLLNPIIGYAQNPVVQNASLPKDAQVDVVMTDFNNNVLPHEIMILRSKSNGREYQGLTDDNGKFSVRLPAGDEYEISILGFKDSTSLDVLKIPALQGNAYYKNPFVLNFQFLPSKNWVLDNCNFDFGKATLQESAYTVLDELVAYLKRKEDDRIEIGGHTDNVGNAASNQKLSLDRANAVKDYLIGKGIDPARLTTKGYGMTQPIADNKTESGRAENRRTEVTIL